MKKRNNFSVKTTRTIEQSRWKNETRRNEEKREKKTVWFIIIIYSLVLHLSALQVRMCMAWWKQSLFEPARSLSIAFSLFIRQIVRVVIFIKKIKLFHSKRSTILMLCKNSKCRIQTKEWAELNAYGKCTRFSFNLQLKFHSSSHYCLPSFYLYSISFTSHTTHLIFPFFYHKRIKFHAVFLFWIRSEDAGKI